MVQRTAPGSQSFTVLFDIAGVQPGVTQFDRAIVTVRDNVQGVDVVIVRQHLIYLIDAIAAAIEHNNFERRRAVIIGLQVINKSLKVGHQFVDENDFLALFFCDRSLLLLFILLGSCLLFFVDNGLLLSQV